MSEARKAFVAGIMVGEGSPYCYRYMGRGAPALAVTMCDEKAMRIVAQDWGLERPWRSSAARCPRTPQNPEGRITLVRRRGYGAQALIERYRPYLEGTDLLRKWDKLLETCPLPPKPHPARRRPAPTLF